MTTTMQAMGVVTNVIGEVFARSAGGEMRRLTMGDQVFEGEVIISANGSSAEITPYDGPLINVAEQQTVVLDSEVMNTAPDPTANAISPLTGTEAATVIQAAGDTVLDLNALLENEAAAAGLIGGDAQEGHTFVDLVRIVEAIPNNAYDFPVNPTGTPPTITGNALVPEATVTPPNLAPIAGNDEAVTPEGRTTLTGTVLGNDTDPEGAPLTVIPGTYTGNLGGSLVLHADGSYDYVSPPSVNNSQGNPTETFVYTVSDGTNTADATLVITITDTGPSAGNDEATVQEGGTVITGSVTANDNPGNDAVGAVYSLVGDGTGALGGHLVLNPDGSYTYTAPASVNNSEGNPTESFTYTLTDGDGTPTQAILTIAITDTGPSAGNDEATVQEGGTVITGSVTANDNPGNDAVGAVYSLVGNGYGSLGGYLVLNPDGSYTYTAPAYVNNSNGTPTETFTYTLNDGDGTPTQATLTIAITDTEPTLSFSNSIGPAGSGSLVYTGLWNEVASADVPNELSVVLNSVLVDGTAASVKNFTFDSGSNSGTGSFTYGSGTEVGFSLHLNGDGTYSLTLDAAVTNVTITPEEFKSAVVASGPTSTYLISYTDTATGTVETATVSAAPTGQHLTLIGADNAAGSATETYSATTTGTLINASSDGIGIGNNVLSSYVSGSTLTAESLTYNPSTPAEDITLFFKATGANGFGQGSADVLYITLTGSNGENETILLDSRYGDFVVNADHSLTPITSSSGDYTGGALTSYTVDTPTGWNGIDSVSVTTGFYTVEGHHGSSIGTTDVKVAFGFTTTTTTVVDQNVQLDFTATVTDSDGSTDHASFIVQSDTDHSFVGTDSADYIVGTSGADTLTGNGGDDILIGGAGADTLTGGAGADTFVWHLADVTKGSTTDTVKDFSSNDSIDLRDLLGNSTATIAVDNTAHTVTAQYTDGAGVHTEVINVEFAATEPNHTLHNTDGVIKIG